MFITCFGIPSTKAPLIKVFTNTPTDLALLWIYLECFWIRKFLLIKDIFIDSFLILPSPFGTLSLQFAPSNLINIERDPKLSFLWPLEVEFNFQIVALVFQVPVASYSSHLKSSIFCNSFWWVVFFIFEWSIKCQLSVSEIPQDFQIWIIRSYWRLFYNMSFVDAIVTVPQCAPIFIRLVTCSLTRDMLSSLISFNWESSRIMKNS